jgi:hypothetical protein
MSLQRDDPWPGCQLWYVGRREPRVTFVSPEPVEPDGEVVLLGGTETFYAELELRHRDHVITVDCRPSDGIAVAVRLGVPIVAADELEPVLATA